MKKFLLISILVVFLVNITVFNSIVNAATSLDSMLSDADGFISQGEQEAIGTDYSGFRDTSTTVFNAFLTIGTIIAAIVISIMGIKFMTSTSEEKAQMKESMLPYVIGCVVIFGAFTIWKVVVNIGFSI